MFIGTRLKEDIEHIQYDEWRSSTFEGHSFSLAETSYIWTTNYCMPSPLIYLIKCVFSLILNLII